MFSFSFESGALFVEKETREIFKLKRKPINTMVKSASHIQSKHSFKIIKLPKKENEKIKLCGSCHVSIIHPIDTFIYTGREGIIQKFYSGHKNNIRLLLLFIVSHELHNSCVTNVFMKKPKLKSFDFMLFCGFRPKLRDLPASKKNYLSIYTGRTFKNISDHDYIEQKFDALDWSISSESSELEKEMDWYAESESDILKGKVWSCHTAHLENNLKNAFIKHFDCESII